MTRCARPGCGHRKRRHRRGACNADPRGHCSAFVAPVPEPTPIVPPLADDAVLPGENLQQRLDAIGPGRVVLVSDGEYVHRISRRLVPRPGQTILLEASIDGGHQVDRAFDLGTGKVMGVRIFGAVTHQGTIRGFVDSAVKLWIDTVVSNFNVEEIAGTGVGGGFDGIRETPAVVEFLRMRRLGSVEALGHDSGAVKFARTGDLVGPIVRYLDIEDVLGNGVWADVQSCSLDVIGCRIAGVGRKGVHWEKSGRSDEMGPIRDGRLVVEDTAVFDSGLEGREHAADAAFALVSSVHATYRRNRSEGARRADFIARQDGRVGVAHEPGDPSHEDKHGWRTEDVVVDDPDDLLPNKIGCDLPGVTCS